MAKCKALTGLVVKGLMCCCCCSWWEQWWKSTGRHWAGAAKRRQCWESRAVASAPWRNDTVWHSNE